jgi:hypothetical protein
MTRWFGVLVFVVALAFALAACGSSSKPSVATGPSGTSPITAAPPAQGALAPWPAPADPMARSRAAGLVPETAEQLQYHVHSHLDVYLNGQHVLVPAGLGIDITNPGVHSAKINGFSAYGGIVSPCDQPCISPLHTHDVTGIIHTESSTHKDNTLGQLFIEWNVRLSATCVSTYCAPATPVSVYVDGTKFTGDPTTIPLSNLEEIAVVIGTPPAQIPNTADWNQI